MWPQVGAKGDRKKWSLWLVSYWVGQKVLLGFPVTSYGKTRMNFLANPILSSDNSRLLKRERCTHFDGELCLPDTGE